jgi:hypothetical protein
VVKRLKGAQVNTGILKCVIIKITLKNTKIFVRGFNYLQKSLVLARGHGDQPPRKMMDDCIWEKFKSTAG